MVPPPRIEYHTYYFRFWKVMTPKKCVINGLRPINDAFLQSNDALKKSKIIFLRGSTGIVGPKTTLTIFLRGSAGIVGPKTP